MSKKTPAQLIPTEKTMLDWFAEHGINHLGVEVDWRTKPRECSLVQVSAYISLDPETGRGSHTFNAFTDEGNAWLYDNDEGEIDTVDAEMFSKHVAKLLEVLRKPYPCTNFLHHD